MSRCIVAFAAVHAHGDQIQVNELDKLRLRCSRRRHAYLAFYVLSTRYRFNNFPTSDLSSFAQHE